MELAIVHQLADAIGGLLDVIRRVVLGRQEPFKVVDVL